VRACVRACVVQSGGGAKKSKSSGPSNHSSQSAQMAARHSNDSNASNQELVASDRRRQCISRRAHRSYLDYLDDSTPTSTDADADAQYSPPLPASPASRELAHQSELVRDPSVFSSSSGGGGSSGVPAAARDARQWRRVQRKAADQRPGLSRLVSDMSDISNSTTSTFVSTTPSQASSALELNERL